MGRKDLYLCVQPRSKDQDDIVISPNVTSTDEDEGEFREPTPLEFIPPREEKSGERAAVSRVEDV